MEEFEFGSFELVLDFGIRYSDLSVCSLKLHDAGFDHSEPDFICQRLKDHLYRQRLVLDRMWFS